MKVSLYPSLKEHYDALLLGEVSSVFASLTTGFLLVVMVGMEVGINVGVGFYFLCRTVTTVDKRMALILNGCSTTLTENFLLASSSLLSHYLCGIGGLLICLSVIFVFMVAVLIKVKLFINAVRASGLTEIN